jgi:hypothetical protein
MMRVIMLVWMFMVLGWVVGSYLKFDSVLLIASSVCFSITICGLGIVDALWNRK